MTRIAIPALALIAWLLATQTALCFYNASTGRWLSRDPIGEQGGVNLYQFVRNSTVDRTDRLGLDINVITGPVHCDLCGGKVYNSQKACCRQGKIISRTETEEVMLTFRKANLPGGGFAYTVGGKSHCSVTTSEGETGQGKMGAGVPGQGAEGCACTLFTEMVDHTGQSKESGVINVKVKVNKCCFLSKVEKHQKEGPWVPLINDCNTIMRDAVESCGGNWNKAYQEVLQQNTEYQQYWDMVERAIESRARYPCVP